jgi:hypothetical protein
MKAASRQQEKASRVACITITKATTIGVLFEVVVFVFQALRFPSSWN